MADWFKFYENDLDETRLQYAIAKLPEVIPVWVGILSEACRHKVGTLSWGRDEIELFGFSRRLGVSIPKVNEAINLLCEIRYITKGDDIITIIKWGEKQSEYCQKLTKRQNQVEKNNPNCPDSVGTVSGQCPPRGEERRGEEIEKNKKVASLPAIDAFEIHPELNNDEFKLAWNKWHEHLKQKRKPATVHARDLQLGKLSKMGCQKAIETLRHCIEHNWQGIYDIQPTNGAHPRKPGKFAP